MPLRAERDLVRAFYRQNLSASRRPETESYAIKYEFKASKNFGSEYDLSVD